MTDQIEIPQNKTISSSATIDQKRIELGVIGKLIGGGPEKAGNIAGMVVFLCFCAIFFTLAIPPVTDFSRKEIILGLFSIMTGALGFLFGSKSSS